MCGIFAMFLRRQLGEDDILKARSVLQEISHRGPDGQGEWVDFEKGVYLGHRRLSIIDVSSASNQPMTSNGTAFIFNGELYNFKELKQELMNDVGLSFSTQGDCEVFMRGWQAWGKGVLEKADAMFASVYWDGNKAIIAVDVFGEKPMFVSENSDGVYICSEIAPLAKLLCIESAISEDGWAAYLSLGFMPQPNTFFPGIEMMMPGTYREVSYGHMSHSQKYWELPSHHEVRGKISPISDSQLDDLLGILVKSLRNRLISDVPLTLFLSAGIDSALVAAICKYELSHDLNCLTVGFRHKGMRDESSAAEKIAAFMGFDHQIVHSDLSYTVENIVDILGQPSGQVGVLPLAQICQVANQKGFKVGLTGMGGDELTFGYGKHYMLWKMRHLHSLPLGARTFIASCMRLCGRKVKNLSSLIMASDEEVYLAYKNYPALSLLKALPGFKAFLKQEFGMSALSPEFFVPKYEFSRVMPAAHLYASDHASMKNSLELRTPFLNKSAVLQIASWDARSLMAYGQKSVLRRLLSRYLPESLINQPKTGFTYPRNALLEVEEPRNISGLNELFVRECWDRRNSGGGWSSIATRMLVAQRFFDR